MVTGKTHKTAKNSGYKSEADMFFIILFYITTRNYTDLFLEFGKSFETSILNVIQ